jgi:hypothetical protein
MKYLLDWWLNDGIWHLSDTIERGLMRLLKKECEDEVTRKGDAYMKMPYKGRG